MVNVISLYIIEMCFPINHTLFSLHHEAGCGDAIASYIGRYEVLRYLSPKTVPECIQHNTATSKKPIERMLLLQLKNCHLIFRFYPLPFPVASQSSARAVSTHALSERMKEMSERIEAMDQITQNMDREFKSSRVVSTRLI